MVGRGSLATTCTPHSCLAPRLMQPRLQRVTWVGGGEWNRAGFCQNLLDLEMTKNILYLLRVQRNKNRLWTPARGTGEPS